MAPGQACIGLGGGRYRSAGRNGIGSRVVRFQGRGQIATKVRGELAQKARTAKDVLPGAPRVEAQNLPSRGWHQLHRTNGTGGAHRRTFILTLDIKKRRR